MKGLGFKVQGYERKAQTQRTGSHTCKPAPWPRHHALALILTADFRWALRAHFGFCFIVYVLYFNCDTVDAPGLRG